MPVAVTTDSLPRLRLCIRAVLACAMVCAAASSAWSACKPNHFRPAFFVKTMGACAFDPQTLSYSGDPVAQAECLMRGMDATRNLAPALESLPPALASRVGQDGGLPSREALSAFLSKENLEWDFAAYLWQPVSRAHDNDADAPPARYFVIHDTSGPNYGHRSFPADIDVSAKLNNLGSFKCSDGWGKAHVVVNRSGGMLLDHDFAIPWRETRFEQAANFAGALKGLFLHVELIQPRRSEAGRGRRNDAQSPNPGFTAAQYDRLALLYVIASVRAEHWLVPAFHAAIDAGIRNGHDDPLHFDVASFADSLERLMATLQGAGLIAAPSKCIARGDGARPIRVPTSRRFPGRRDVGNPGQDPLRRRNGSDGRGPSGQPNGRISTDNPATPRGCKRAACASRTQPETAQAITKTRTASSQSPNIASEARR